MLVSVYRVRINRPEVGNSLQAFSDPAFGHAIPPRIRCFVNTKEVQYYQVYNMTGVEDNNKIYYA